MKFWISTYALSTGIFEVDGEISDDHPDMISWGESFKQFAHGEGRQWHRTREGAVERAEVLRENKIASVKKQLAKLQGLKF